MLLTLLVTAKYFPALDQGYDACPCVDPYPLSGPGTGHSNCSGILRGGACYPSGYGARGCRAYDNSEFSGGDAPVECQAETPPRCRLVEVERKYLEAKAAAEKVTEKIEAEEDAAELAPEFF